MNAKQKIMLLTLLFCIIPTFIQTKTYVYLRSYLKNNPIRVMNIRKTDKNTEIISPSGSELSPYKFGEKNRVMVFKLGRGAGSSEDSSSATIQIGISENENQDHEWVDLFNMKQQVEHRFAHSNVYASLQTKKFDSGLKEGNPNEPIITTTKVAGKNVGIALKKIDIKGGDDDYVYMVFDYEPNPKPKDVKKEAEPTLPQVEPKKDK